MLLELLEKIIEDQRRQLIESPTSPSTEPAIRRQVSLSAHLSTPEITVISGVRRCGKSYLLKALYRELMLHSPVLYIDFEDTRLEQFEVADWTRLHEYWLLSQPDNGEQRYLLVDEVQLSPSWERWMPYFANQSGTKVIVTGSNSTMLGSELSTHLTGRHQVLHMQPLCWREIADHEGVGTDAGKDTQSAVERRRIFLKYRERGGFPRIYLQKNYDLLRQYYRDIVLKDILVRKKVRNSSALLELSKLLASDNACLFNLSKNAVELGLKDQSTIRKFIGYFIDVYLFSELRKFDPSLRRQRRSNPKFFCIDHALARENSFAMSPNLGRELENLVQTELNFRGLESFYWHSKAGEEVDFIVREGIAPVAAIQVCHNLTALKTKQRELRGLLAAKSELGVSELELITDDESGEIKIDGVPIRYRRFTDWAQKGS